MSLQRHPMPLSGGDRKALKKEIAKAQAMTSVYARQATEKRVAGEALIAEADKLDCWSWNERMWAAGEPIDPSPTVDQAVRGGFPWLEIECSRCKAKRDVDLAQIPHVGTTFIHDLASRLRCQRCSKAGKRPTATLVQLQPKPRHEPPEIA